MINNDTPSISAAAPVRLAVPMQTQWRFAGSPARLRQTPVSPYQRRRSSLRCDKPDNTSDEPNGTSSRHSPWVS